jgi:hypothetical protein
VATDPLTTSTITAESTAPVIENEFPSYRAISRGAVFSALFGILSLFCFADPWDFLILPILAIITGIFADFRIKRYSDILTGRKIAHAGIAMGLMFGLSAMTLDTVQRFLYSRSAAQFSENYVAVLQKGQFKDLLYYAVDPKRRKTTTPDKLLEEHRSRTSDAQASAMAEMRYGGYQRLMSRLASGGEQHIEFEGIDRVGMDEDKPYALATFKVHGPTSKEFPEEEQRIGALLKSLNDGSESPWWVDTFSFPLKGTADLAPTPKPVDDGHGHGH